MLALLLLVFNRFRLKSREALMLETVKQERAVSARLREVDKLKDEFLANTSHELRTPPFGITGLAESLIDGATGELPEETQANLSMIVASGRRLGRLINDILDYSRLTHHGLSLTKRPIDLRITADVVWTLAGPLAASKELELVNSIPPDLPAADADENRLEQILHNLVGNAVKFTEAGKAARRPDRRARGRARDRAGSADRPGGSCPVAAGVSESAEQRAQVHGRRDVTAHRSGGEARRGGGHLHRARQRHRDRCRESREDLRGV